MKKTGIAAIISLILLVISCRENSGYEKLDNGIVVYLPSQPSGARVVRIEVMTDKIIHVIASPTRFFAAEESLMVLPGIKPSAAWSVKQTNGSITLSTVSLSANVSLTTGEVVFTDASGKVLLAEQKGGGKTFQPGTVDNHKSYQIRQVWESADDEAFYGLGGHQNGQMNYKGQDVELVQHNIVGVVPFLYSSKNYGILWDNYSITKFGDPRDYLPLNSLTLYTPDGKKGGLTATYHVGDNVLKKVTENKIDFEFLETPPVEGFPQEVARNGKVVWEGSFASEVEGMHKFLVYASGYFKVWIDDALIMDKWRQGWNPWTNKFSVDIRKGEIHSLKIEWIPDGGAYLAVKHLDPLSEPEQNQLSLFSEVADEINYYFIRGDNADDVISGYRKLTGKAPIVPRWALGYWQSRERYKNQKELLDVVREYRKRNIPLDNIVLDWQYWKDSEWGSHEFDRSRFPDPKAMVDELHQKLNANIMISVWPKFNKGTANYEEMYKQGFLFTNNVEKKRKDWVGPGYESTFYDPFNGQAGALFWKQIDTKLNALGFDAWWLDATEPDMHSNLSIEERKKNMTPTAMGPGAKYFNAYSLMNSRSVYEGLRKSNPDKRVFILTRSAYAGQQRYGAATWSGDIVSRWSDFQDQIAAGINFSLSGIPYWTMDIGGFAVEKRFEKLPQANTHFSAGLQSGVGVKVSTPGLYESAGASVANNDLDEWRELNVRWFQFGAFCPIFRSHGQYPYREIYNIAPQGHEVYNSMVYYTRLRYHLLPYIYSLAGKAYFDDYTFMRGLVMDFNNDSKVHNIGDQYMFGPALLINPVYEYQARKRQLYLPAASGWYDLYSGKYYEGGQMIKADAPLDRMPVFVRSGSIVPAAPEMQYSTEKPNDPLTVYIYAGGDGYFELYEDDNTNYNYENGAYSIIPFTYDEETETLTIGPRKGHYKNLSEERIFRIVWVKTDRPVGVSYDARSDQEVRYTGKVVQVRR